MKTLPIGKQNFEEIILENNLYVDKTAQIFQLLNTGKLYFLSRPRRFGKSLLLSTFRYLFEGRKDLFSGLYLAKTDYNFDKFPVLQFNFASYGDKIKNWNEVLHREVLSYADAFSIDVPKINLAQDFHHLVTGISKRGKPVVLLIDEYDRPIIDFLTEPEKAAANREILRTFFSPLKDLDAQGHLRFLFITGVSKFSKVSLFSDLNNLVDLSLGDPLSHDLLGVSQAELAHYFEPYVKRLQDNYKTKEADLLNMIKLWYNGYSFGGGHTLYNPFSLLLLFHKQRFDNYWFETGTPTFLVEIIQKVYVNPKELERVEVDNYFFNNFSLEDLDIVGLLYQTGYLTIKETVSDFSGSIYVLGYPNIEVRHSMMYNLMQVYAHKTKSIVSTAMVQMRRGLETGDANAFVRQLKILLSDISYHLHPKKLKNEAETFRMWEGYFQTIIYLATSFMDISVQTEVTKHKGRLDLIAETKHFIYLMEFKLDESEAAAITQIKQKEYAAAYQNTTKKVFLVGVNFSKTEKNVENWSIELWER